MRISILFLLLAMVLPLQAQEATYRLEAGKEYRYYLESSSSQIQEYMGQVMNASSEVNLAAKMFVDEVLEDGSMKLTITCENAMIMTESPQGSETKGGDWAGKLVKLTLGGDGNIVEVDTNIVEADAEAASVLLQVAGMFPKLDREKLSVGNSWERSSADTSGNEQTEIITETESEFIINQKSEVAGLSCLKIEVKSEADISGDIPQGNLIGTREAEGTLYYADAEGLLVKFESEIATDQTISLTGGNGQVPISSSVTVTLELIQ